MNIVLVGYRCSGKTTVGKLLARDLEKGFLDTDHLIEAKTGVSIASYVSQNGWKNFRRVEREIIEAIATKNNMVIATGGGVVMEQENVEDLKRNGWVVWLITEASVIRERMKHAQAQDDFRPALSGADPLNEIDTILRERSPAYERASNYRVSTDAKTAEQVEQAIMNILPHTHRDGNGGSC
ncbi:MAG: shikimate kinase [Deltaproteobacteria bacterium]|nr:shikimate kinase [Deltaproteobacteria bacterium]